MAEISCNDASKQFGLKTIEVHRNVAFYLWMCCLLKSSHIRFIKSTDPYKSWYVPFYSIGRSTELRKNHLLTETSEQLTCRSGLILGKKSISEYKINEVYQFNQILAIILPTPLPVAFPESLRWSWSIRWPHLYGTNLHKRYVIFYPKIGIILLFLFFPNKQSTCPIGDNLLL